MDDAKIAPILVMDANDEDDSKPLPRPVGALPEKPDRVVVVERGAKSESTAFRFRYRASRVTVRQLTDKSMDLGNSCVMPRNAAERVRYMSETWNRFGLRRLCSRLSLERVGVTCCPKSVGACRADTVALLAVLSFEGLATRPHAVSVAIRRVQCVQLVAPSLRAEIAHQGDERHLRTGANNWRNLSTHQIVVSGTGGVLDLGVESRSVPRLGHDLSGSFGPSAVAHDGMGPAFGAP